MILTEFLPPNPLVFRQLARPMWIRQVIVNAAADRTGLNLPWDLDALHHVVGTFASEGWIVHGLEGDQLDMRRIKLRLDGHDDGIDHFCRLLHNMAELRIPLLCYSFMTQIGRCLAKLTLAAAAARVACFDVKNCQSCSSRPARFRPSESGTTPMGEVLIGV
jgi:D-mannonate dehydratase